MNTNDFQKKMEAYLLKLEKGEKGYYEVEFFEQMLDDKLAVYEIDKTLVEEILAHFQEIHSKHFLVCYYMVKYLWLVNEKKEELIEYSYNMLEQYPGEIDGVEMAAFIFYENKLYEHSKQLFELCLEFEETMGEEIILEDGVTNIMTYQAHIGKCACFIKSYQETIDFLTKGISHKNIDEIMVEMLYDSYVQTNQLKEGIDFFTSLYHSFPLPIDQGRVLVAISKLFQRRGQLHKAIEFMRLAYRYSSWGDADEFLVAKLLEQANRYKEAIQHYKLLYTEEKEEEEKKKKRKRKRKQKNQKKI